MRTMHTIMALALAAGAALSDAPRLLSDSPRPLVFTKALVSLDPARPPAAAALLIEGGRITFVGEEAEARRRGANVHASVIELPGAVIYPGWTDAHGHLLSLGEGRENLDLRGKSKEEVLRLVAERAARSTPGTWIQGRGWDQNLWPGGAFPNSTELSARSPKNPVALSRIDGHAVWANDLAMGAARIADDVANPSGGRVLRDPSGRPTGIFVDNAEDLIRRAIPEPGAKERARSFETAFAACARVGLTGVGDASSYERASIDVLRELARTRRMPIRVYATVGAGDPRLEEFLSAPRIEEGRLTVRAVKMYADGALGSRGAALLADYADEPGNRGLVVTPPDEMARVAERCFRAGWQIWTHAIGDRGNRLALEAYEKAMVRVHPPDARPRIEHAQVIALEDRSRWAALGVIASVQPAHATSDMGWAAQRLGPARLAGAYAWRKLRDAGIRLAGGSDFPVESEDPKLGLYAAVTRRDPAGQPPGGWRPEESLTPFEALKLFTADNAYAEFAEKRRGRIAMGFDADLTILDRDVEAVTPSDILTSRVLMTVVGGEIVFQER